MYPDVTKTERVFLTKENPFERFRIGDGPGSYHKDPAQMKPLPGNQFPLEGYDNFTRQVVPRLTSTDAPTIAADIALVDRVCPCVVLVEPAGVGDVAQAAALKDTPTLSLYGDYIATDARWPTIRGNNLKFHEALRAAGGQPDLIDLPAMGIKGNSHLLMMDRNNLEVADVIQRWLSDKGFVRGSALPCRCAWWTFST